MPYICIFFRKFVHFRIRKVMKYLIYFLAIIFLLGINIGLFGYIPFYGQIPNLLLLFACFFAMEKQSYDGFYVCLFAGLFLDFFSTQFFGGFTVAFLSLGLVLHLMFNYFLAMEVNWKMLGGVLCAVLILFYGSLWIYGFLVYKFNLAHSYLSLADYSRNLLPALVYNLLLMYPIYIFYETLQEWVEKLLIRQRGVIK